jgi:hypothetical protein
MRTRELLVGRDWWLAVRALAVALVLAGVASGLVWTVVRSPTADLPVARRTALRWLLLGGIAVGGLGAAAVAHLNDGVIPTVVLATAAPFGFYLGLAATGTPIPGGSIAEGLGTAAGVGVGVGTPAFLVGVVSRKLRS